MPGILQQCWWRDALFKVLAQLISIQSLSYTHLVRYLIRCWCYWMLSKCYIATEVLELESTMLLCCLLNWKRRWRRNRYESLAYTHLVGVLDVVESLHCHRSLGVGVYNVAMLLAELETTWRRDRNDVTALLLRCCVLAANLNWIDLLMTLESIVWLIRSCMVLAEL